MAHRAQGVDDGLAAEQADLALVARTAEQNCDPHRSSVNVWLCQSSRPQLDFALQPDFVLLKHFFANDLDQLEHIFRPAAGMGDDEVCKLVADLGLADLEAL